MNNQIQPHIIKATQVGTFVYFSELMDRPVYDKNNAQAGELYDIIVRAGQVYPLSTGLIIRKNFPNRQYAAVEWPQIKSIDKKEVRLTIEKKDLIFKEVHDNKDELTLRRDILDQQVVDTYDYKVIRVNDIHMLFVEDALVIAHVDMSLRGLLRRLGFEPFAMAVVRLFNKNARFLSTENLTSCKYIQPLNINPASMTIKIDVPQKQISNIPAADLGDIFLDLGIQQKIALFKSLDLSSRAKIFSNIDFKSQDLLIDALPDRDVVEVLKNIPSDEATDFLEKLPKDRTDRYLNLMETPFQKKLSQLIGYSSDSAGGLMTKDFLTFAKGTLISQVLKQIRELGARSEPLQVVYIVDETGHFLGTTNFRRLILAEPEDPIEKTVFPKNYFVHLDSGVREVAYLMEKYKYNVIPVLDENNVIQGVITVDDVLSQLITIAFRRLKKIRVLSKNELKT